MVTRRGIGRAGDTGEMGEMGDKGWPLPDMLLSPFGTIPGPPRISTMGGTSGTGTLSSKVMENSPRRDKDFRPLILEDIKYELWSKVVPKLDRMLLVAALVPAVASPLSRPDHRSAAPTGTPDHHFLLAARFVTARLRIPRTRRTAKTKAPATPIRARATVGIPCLLPELVPVAPAPPEPLPLPLPLPPVCEPTVLVGRPFE